MAVTLDHLQKDPIYDWYSSTPTDLLSSNERLPCNYIIPSEFKQNSAEDNYISLLNFNIRSLKAHFHELDSVLADMTGGEESLRPDVIALSEIFNIGELADLQLRGYHKLLYKCRPPPNDSRGGVGLFINNQYTVKIRNDLCLFVPHVFESIFAEICKDKKSFIVASIYRPNTLPLGSVNSFLQHMSTTLQLLTHIKNCFIMGDFNIDFLKWKNDSQTNDFIEIMLTNGFLPTITKPTRVSSTTATLIDQIFIKTETLSPNMTAKIILTDITDHFPTHFSINKETSNTIKQRHTFTRRNFKEENIKRFQEMLSVISFNEVYQCDSPEEAYNSFFDIFKTIYDLCFPLEEVCIPKKYIKIKPWMTTGLLNSSLHKQKLYKANLKDPTNYQQTYKTYTKIFNKVYRQAKQLYFITKFLEYRKDIKQTWVTIYEALNISKAKDQTCLLQLRTEDNRIITGDSNIANEFNIFFSETGKRIEASIDHTNDNYKDYLHPNFPQSFFLVGVVPKEVELACKELKTKN